MSAGRIKGRWIEPSKREDPDFFPMFAAAQADVRVDELEWQARRALREKLRMAVVRWSHAEQGQAPRP